MYLSTAKSNSSDEGDYFSYAVSNKTILDNAKVCLGGFSGSGPEYQMYKSNCMDLMTQQCSKEWSEACDLYQDNLNKQEQELFQQSLSFRSSSLPVNSYNSCKKVSGVLPYQYNMSGINPIVVGDTEVIMPLSCPFQTREGFKPLSNQSTPQPFSPERPPVVTPIGTPQPFLPVSKSDQNTLSELSPKVQEHYNKHQQLMKQSTIVKENYSANNPAIFSPDRPLLGPPVGTPQPFSPERPVVVPPIGTPQPFIPPVQQQAGTPQPFSPDRPVVVPPIGTPQPFIPPVQQQTHYTPIPFMPGMHQMNAAQPQSQMNSSQLQSQMNAAQHQSQMNATQPQRQMNSSQLQNQMNSSQLQRQMNAAQHQSQMNATQPQRQMNALPQGMRVYNPQLVSLPHNQMPRATVPPHPITNVEPVKPIGTPVPFYPIPEQRKQVSFLDTPQIRLISTEETVIQNLISGEEKDCQTTCSISKILQQ